MKSFFTGILIMLFLFTATVFVYAKEFKIPYQDGQETELDLGGNVKIGFKSQIGTDAFWVHMKYRNKSAVPVNVSYTIKMYDKNNKLLGESKKITGTMEPKKLSMPNIVIHFKGKLSNDDVGYTIVNISKK